MVLSFSVLLVASGIISFLLVAGELAFISQSPCSIEDCKGAPSRLWVRV